MLSSTEVPLLLSGIWSLVHTDYCYKQLVSSGTWVFMQCLSFSWILGNIPLISYTSGCSELREAVSLPSVWTPE